MNVLALCAGAGGLELGIKLAVPAARGIAYVEREAAAAAKLVQRMETGDLAPAPVWSDLATFDARAWRGRVHCVASGDPCQPNSVAGKRGGAADDRFLADQVLRIVDECRPDRLFRENVPGNADGQLAVLAPTLEGMGYRVAAGIFSSAETGNSHRRERLILMADRTDCAGRLYARQWRPGEGAADAGGLGGSVDDAERAERWAHGRPCDGDGPNGNAQREEGAGRARASGEAQAGRHGERAMPAIADDACGGLFPLVCPGPSDARWPDILAAAPELEPAVCRVAHAMAPFLDEVINEAEQRSQGRATAYLDGWREVQRMWLTLLVASSSRRLFETSGGQLPLFGMSRSTPSSSAGGEVRDLRLAVQAEKVAALYALWRSEVQECARQIIRRGEMGWSRVGPDLQLVRDGLLIFSGKADDVFAVLREQIGMGRSQMSRVDRLRLLGNGVDPVAAAYAWICLDALQREAAGAGIGSGITAVRMVA